MATYTIQSILGHETGVQIGDRTFDAYTIQLAEDQRPVRVLRTPGNAPSLGPVQADLVEDQRGPRLKLIYAQQQTSPQGAAAPQTLASPNRAPSEDYEARQKSIVRQHSQGMALQAYPLIYGQPSSGNVTPPTVAEFLVRLRPLIDLFDADAQQKHELVQAESPTGRSDSDIPF